MMVEGVWRLFFCLPLALLLALACYEKRGAIARRVFPQKYPYEGLSKEYHSAVLRASRAQLFNVRYWRLLAHPQRNASHIETALRHILKQKDYNANNWPNAMLAHGLLTSYRATHHPEALAAVEKFCDRLTDENGRFTKPLTSVEQCMIGYTLLGLFDGTHKDRYKVACDAIASFLTSVHPVSGTGTLPYNTRHPVQYSLLLVDALAMVCPFLVRYGEAFGRNEAIELGVKQLAEFLDNGMDVHTNLPYHGYNVNRKGGLGIVGWARGTGWLAIGLVDSLAHLHQHHARYAELAQWFRALIGAVSQYQTDEGYWTWAVHIPMVAEEHIDTSGTAMIAYAVERGVEIGVLDKKCLDISMRALGGLVRATDQQGVVDNAQASIHTVGSYPAYFAPAPWAQGPTTALCAIVLQRLQQS